MSSPLAFVRASLSVFVAGLSITSPAWARTLTSADGRTMEAEVLGFEGEKKDKVRIKRAADGQVFTMPIDSFAEADAAALREEAAKPAPIRDGDIVVGLSKVTFDSRKTTQDVPLTNGDIARGALVTTEDDIGYAVTLTNRTGKPIENLRGECLLYVRMDALRNSTAKPQIRREPSRVKFDPLPAGGKVSARTGFVTTTKTELKGNVKWRGTDDAKTRDTVEGIWLRIYQADTLVLETALPSNLAEGQSWPAATGQGGAR